MIEHIYFKLHDVRVIERGRCIMSLIDLVWRVMESSDTATGRAWRKGEEVRELVAHINCINEQAGEQRYA